MTPHATPAPVLPPATVPRPPVRRASASERDGAGAPPVCLSGVRRADGGPDRPLRVLIVEDEAIIAMDLEMTLEDMGAQVVGIAMTAADAARLAKLHRPDCVTMDINIKGDRDGVSAAIEIYETVGIRSIFVSAYGNDETLARAAAANPIGWVMKPIDVRDLREAFARILDKGQTS